MSGFFRGKVTTSANTSDATSGPFGSAASAAVSPIGPVHLPPNLPPVTLQKGDSIEITERITMLGDDSVGFDELVLRVQALTGLNARQASVVAGEILALRGEAADAAGGEFAPFNPPDHLVVYKAKELGYLPDNWRLP